MSDISQADEGRAKPLARILDQMSLLVFFLAALIGLTSIIGVSLNRRGQINLAVGEIAEEIVEAPRSINYESDVLTERERERVASGIYVYTQFDRSVGREQANQARELFRYIEVVRGDPLAAAETKLSYVQAVENLDIPVEIGQLLLNLPQDEFIVARNETVEQISSVMVQTIRPEQLTIAKRDASSQISFDLNQNQEQIVLTLAPQFIVPNVFLDENQTAVAREEAAAGVVPIELTITQGQPILLIGDEVTAEDLEALGKLGLIQQDVTDWFRLGSAFLIATLASLLLMIYWWRFMDQEQYTRRHLFILLFLVLSFTAGARVAMYYDLIYLFPAAGLAMLLAVVINSRISLIVMSVVAGLVGYMAGETLEPAVYVGVGSLIAGMTLQDRHRFGSYFRAGAFGVVGNLGVILIFNLSQTADYGELGIDLLIGIINGIAFSPIVTIAGFFLVGLFGVITVVQLQDLSRLDHPLLQELLRRAPGTYHHSIMVANLAEQAAERIGANGTLVRVGAFYHDIGKMDQPEYFSENQAGTNLHADLSPYISADIIISHVTKGLEKARKARLPHQIQNFIAEHHGRGVIRFFYEKARELAGDNADEVDQELFRYIGPRPRSRETAIVLLADTVEAAASAIRPETEEEIDKMVNRLVEDHIKDGQLDRSHLTMGNISEIKDSFIETLKGRYHLRVKYPGNSEMMEDQQNQLEEADVQATPQNGSSGRPNSNRPTHPPVRRRNSPLSQTIPIIRPERESDS